MMYSEDKSKYSQMKYFDDVILKHAVNKIGNWKVTDYSLFLYNHNCQDYVTTVVHEYNRLQVLYLQSGY